MTAPLEFFVVGYAGLLGSWALASAGVGARLGAAFLGSLLLLELTLLVRAGFAVAGLASDRVYAEPAVHLAYAIASVALLPLLAALTGHRPAAGRGSRPGDRWDALLAAVACAAVIVITLRLAATAR